MYDAHSMYCSKWHSSPLWHKRTVRLYWHHVLASSVDLTQRRGNACYSSSSAVWYIETWAQAGTIMVGIIQLYIDISTMLYASFVIIIIKFKGSILRAFCLTWHRNVNDKKINIRHLIYRPNQERHSLTNTLWIGGILQARLDSLTFRQCIQWWIDEKRQGRLLSSNCDIGIERRAPIDLPLQRRRWRKNQLRFHSMWSNRRWCQ